MLFLHETHEVRGARESDFDAAYREVWMSTLARGDEARLLYFLRHAHGTGPSYRIVTITAVRDGAAWEKLARRIESGDLTEWAASVDELRHEVEAKILIPLPWSPLQSIDLAAVPTDARTHDLSLFMEDTVWPYEGKLGEYIERSGSHYAEEMKHATEVGPRILTVDASYRTAFGTGRRREIVLWQKVVQTAALERLLCREVPEAYLRPGTWMHDALALRDQWRSRLLRTVSWSPLH
ncbi:MAG: hypothetical protein FJ144_00460 [Deltaproteobacteria bacterium]|nr:hypothetical protein [Deltaproteobacteria bacterium]